MIEFYRFGRMKINRVEYTTDLKIINGQVIADWWRSSGHVVRSSDIRDILDSEVKILVIGKGDPGLMEVAQNLKNELEQRGIKLIDKPTADAYPIFNHYYKLGEKVAAAFHLTC